MREISIKLKDVLLNSGYFDEEWYVKKYRDVKLLNSEPIAHYLKYGVLLKRNPSKYFSTQQYIENYKDVSNAGFQPLEHFIKYGIKEGRKPFGEISLDVIGTIIPKSIKKRVIYHSHNLKWQGAPNSLFEISKGNSKSEKYSSMLVVSSKEALLECYEQENIPYRLHPFPSRGMGDNNDEYQKRLIKLAELYTESGAEIIHANTLQCYFSVLAAKIANIPVVWNIRESEEPSTYFDYLPEALREPAFNAIKEADAVIFVARSTMELWLGHFSGDNFHLINNGVDVSRLKLASYGLEKRHVRKMLDLNEDDVCILNVGTISDRKNQLDVVKAYEILIDKGVTNSVLILVGGNNSPYSKELNLLSEDINRKGGRIRIIEETSGIDGLKILSKYYLAADIFNLCSFVESYPRVIIEAFAYGLPVVASKCFGTVEQIVDNKNGFFYEVSNFEDLSNKIERLVVNSCLREKMSFQAMMRQKELNSYKYMIQCYQNVYEKITKKSD